MDVATDRDFYVSIIRYTVNVTEDLSFRGKCVAPSGGFRGAKRAMAPGFVLWKPKGASHLEKHSN